MGLRLHKNTEDFKDLITVTSETLGLDPTIIEKDYWVTHALYRLSKSEYIEHIVIKGGTSLTKGYEDLHRFSEDIDIALLTSNVTNSQIKKIMSKVEKIMSAELSIKLFNDECKSGDYRYTQFSYPSIFMGYLSELHPSIRFEISSFMHPHPYEKKELCSMIGNYLYIKEMQNVLLQYDLIKFNLNVLAIERTVVEKIASLIRMSYESNLSEFLSKTRHLYDLYMTYNTVKDFYNNKQKFIEMVVIVKNAELKSRFKGKYPVENSWRVAPLFKILEEERVEIAYRDYFGAEFVYGKLPDYNQVKSIFRELHNLFFLYEI
ncbi:MAG: hypothetical protein FD141_1558 [Fusobacteria bacterium]|nr:MAG: hypothetical protein FD141_1558 [Fusobacteriota bacterium]KAF0230271.1 MAG: hypothetical protein FD182_661 [Fusobacteriota bacterium]